MADYIQKNICMDIETINRVETFHQLMLEVDAPYFNTRKKWETYRYLLEQGLMAHNVANKEAAAEEGCDDCEEHFEIPGDSDEAQIYEGEGFDYEAERMEDLKDLRRRKPVYETGMNDHTHPYAEAQPVREHVANELIARLNKCGVDPRDVFLIKNVVKNLRPGLYNRELDAEEVSKLEMLCSSMVLTPPGTTTEYRVQGYDLQVQAQTRDHVVF